MGSPDTNREDDFEALFPRAVTYRALRDADPAHALRETPAGRPQFPYSERHLQSIWYDPAWRPHPLTTRDGEQVFVEHPGLWNQEAGPDFLGAVLRVGPAARRLAGDVEIHIHPSDWTAHGHATDPRYRNVRFHVTYFPGTARQANLVPGALQISLKDALAARPAFSFDLIDPTAYPYAARADMPPCSLVLKAYTPEQRRQVLQAAGEERLRRKARRLAAAIAERGPAQVLYEELMVALGYKHNKQPFREIATTLSLDRLRDEANGNPNRAYALMMGIGGLLPEQPSRRWDPAMRRWMRGHWDFWWRHRDAFSDQLPLPQWRMDGVRPANRPERRLMAAAHLFCGHPEIERQLHPQTNESAAAWLKRVLTLLQQTTDPFLSRRQGFSGTPTRRPVALIGATRATAIVVNVITLWLLAQDVPAEFGRAVLAAMPPESANQIMKQTAFYLFGRDHNPTLYRDALARQGLLQVFHDFCLNDRSRCATCCFPAALTAHLQRRG
jgi:hypothetical protein